MDPSMCRKSGTLHSWNMLNIMINMVFYVNFLYENNVFVLIFCKIKNIEKPLIEVLHKYKKKLSDSASILLKQALSGAVLLFL